MFFNVDMEINKKPEHERSFFNVKNFSTETTLHGFKELYYSKRICWKIFWSILMFGALCMTCFHVFKSVSDFASQPTVTKIEPLEKGNLFYPPLRLCYDHWISWVDFEKIEKLNISKSVLLYGLSFHTPIFSDEDVDNEDVKGEFENLMNSNNWFSIMDFYLSISKNRAPGVIEVSEVYSLFEDKEIYNALFCYVTTSTSLINITKQQTSNYKMNHYNFKQVSFRVEKTVHSGVGREKFLTNAEAVGFIEFKWRVNVSHASERVVYSYLSLKNVLVNEDIDSLLMTLEDDEYTIRLNANVHKWKNTKRYPCDENLQTNAAADYCPAFCLMKAISSLCGCTVLVLSGLPQSYSWSSLCQFKINYYTPDYSDPIQDFIAKALAAVCDNEQSAARNYTDCLLNCNDGCERWNYDLNIAKINMPTWMSETQMRNYTIINVRYPTEEAITVVSEIDAKTWDGVISEIGGLLGIWLGASIVSFIQAIYLCCFSE